MALILGLLIAVSAFVGCFAVFVASIDGPPRHIRLAGFALAIAAFGLTGLLSSCT